ncbi:AAA family ATPase [Promicromonospora sp. NPDC057138]|uniref:AAA family ATPase n=1 Tax=Promicromonospora sp. NPDC057138 TaxID=3346031 RepID=UPI00363E80EA
MPSTPPVMMRALAALVRANVPVLIMGNPGQGKTKKLERIGRAWGRHVETISASARETVDFMGLPMEDGGQVVYSPLSWAVRLADAPSGLLVVDEITTAQSTFKAFLRILQERYVGEFLLPDSVSIIAIGNPPEIAVDGIDLPGPVANRFAHLDWYVDRDEWMTHVGTSFTQVPVHRIDSYLTDGSPADRARAVALVTGFLQHRPDLLDAIPDDLVAQSGAWPSERSWANTIDALSFVPPHDEDLRDLLLRSLVGSGTATELLAWLAIADLADPVKVLADPASVDWSSQRPDRLFGLLNAIAAVVDLDGTVQRWKQGMAVATACANGGRPDVALPFARRLANHRHAQHGLPGGFKAAFADLFTRTGQLAAV